VRYRPPSSVERRRVHPLVSLALLQSSSCLRRPDHPGDARASPEHQAPSLGFPSSSRRQSSESTTDEHPRLAYVPSSAFLTLATACSSLTLADLFHPAATSRILAPGVSSPDPAAPPRRWHVPPRRWHHSPVPGCPVTPAPGASTSRSRSEPRSATPAEGPTPRDVRIPSCDSLLRARLSQPW